MVPTFGMAATTRMSLPHGRIPGSTGCSRSRPALSTSCADELTKNVDQFDSLQIDAALFQLRNFFQRWVLDQQTSNGPFSSRIIASGGTVGCMLIRLGKQVGNCRFVTYRDQERLRLVIRMNLLSLCTTRYSPERLRCVSIRDQLESGHVCCYSESKRDAVDGDSCNSVVNVIAAKSILTRSDIQSAYVWRVRTLNTGDYGNTSHVPEA